jgi:spore germination protein YaaH
MTIIYKSPFGKTLQTLKRVSLGTTSFTIISSPFLHQLTFALDIPYGAKVITFSTLMAAGIGSTFLINHFMKPYVTEIIAKDEKSFFFKTIDLLSREKASPAYTVDQIQPFTDKAFVTHSTRDGKRFYIHENILNDKTFLTKLNTKKW